MNPDKTKVILVGNLNFPNWGGEPKDIPNVDQNLDRLKKIFFDDDYFGIPNDAKHLVEIKDGTSQEILLKVKHETKSFVGKDEFERLIFYYSGHGIPGEDRKLFFASKDTVRSDYEITSVDSIRLFSYLKGFGAKELIIILDCCYAAQTRENMGDTDSLIKNCLPEEKVDIEKNENGTYYLFAAGRDNVAKFNPKEPKEPTYFTKALLSSIETGIELGHNFITIGEFYPLLCNKIKDLQKLNPEIPNARPAQEGEVSGFYFCKNKRFENQEDKDWAKLLSDPTFEALEKFQTTYPATKFESEVNILQGRLMEGWDEIQKAKDNNDKKAAIQIKLTYKDIPIIYKEATKILNQMAAKYKEFEKAALGNIATKAEITEASPKLAQAVNPEQPPIQKPADSGSIRIESDKTASEKTARSV